MYLGLGGGCGGKLAPPLGQRLASAAADAATQLGEAFQRNVTAIVHFFPDGLVEHVIWRVLREDLGGLLQTCVRLLIDHNVMSA